MKNGLPPEIIIKEHSILAKIAARKLKCSRVAITIGNNIYLHNTSKEAFLQDKAWLCHELKHVQQFQQYGYFNFMLKYLLESFRKGYFNNKFEIAARKAENDLYLLTLFEII